MKNNTNKKKVNRWINSVSIEQASGHLMGWKNDLFTCKSKKKKKCLSDLGKGGR